MSHRVKQTKDGQWIVANDYDGRRLAGPFDSRQEAVIASAGDLPRAPTCAKDLKSDKNAVMEAEESQPQKRGPGRPRRE